MRTAVAVLAASASALAPPRARLARRASAVGGSGIPPEYPVHGDGGGDGGARGGCACAVLGGGSFGLAMACVLARNGHAVTVLARSRADADAVNARSRHPRYLADVDVDVDMKPKDERLGENFRSDFEISCRDEHRSKNRPEPPQSERDIGLQRLRRRYLADIDLPRSVRATDDARDALRGAELVVHAVPVQHSRRYLRKVAKHVEPRALVLCTSKGATPARGSEPRTSSPGGRARDRSATAGDRGARKRRTSRTDRARGSAPNAERPQASTARRSSSCARSCPRASAATAPTRT